MTMMQKKEAVEQFYNQTKDTFDVSYDWDGPIYPSNRVRMDHCLDQLSAAQAYRVLDAGCGTGTILLELLRRGYDAYGYDFSAEAVSKCKEKLAAEQFDPARVQVGDIETTETGGAPYDAVIIMGAFTHPLDHARALRTLHGQVKAGGLLIVELRNELFKLWAHDQMVVPLYQAMLPSANFAHNAIERLAAAIPARVSVSRGDHATAEHEKFFDVPSVWRNPLTVSNEYASANFITTDILYFHWHAAPPSYIADEDAGAMRKASLELEHYPHDWRGLFMASAFLLCARAVKA